MSDISYHRLYRGTAGNTVTDSLAEVPPSRCLAQAILTSGAQVMTASSTLALVIEVCESLSPFPIFETTLLDK